MRRNAWLLVMGLLAGWLPAAHAVSPADVAVLKPAEVRTLKAVFKQARAGTKPNLGKVPELLHGHAMAAWLLGHGHRSTATELNSWLRAYPELGPAEDIYRLAEQRQKATPPKPAAVLAREARREAAREAQEARRAKLSEAGRRLAGESWRLRQARKYDEVLAKLRPRAARQALGDAWWQEELVRLADLWHARGEYAKLYEVAKLAASVAGPERDEALWQAGFAAYRLGKRGEAAGFWTKLVESEPVRGKHHARAAWWAARVYADLGQQTQRVRYLEAAAQSPLTFYGQLALERLGRSSAIDFTMPVGTAAGLQAILAEPRARLGLALAQLEEYAWADDELRAALPNLPLDATQTLAAVAVQLELPSLALRAGRQLLDEGKTVGAALFPLPPWEPEGGWQTDRAFMLGVMRQESAFQPTVGSHAGARGLMQIMPATGRYIANMTGRRYRGTADLHDPAINMAMAQDYFAYLGSKLDNSKLLVTAAYNGGIGNVRRWISRGTTPDNDPVLWMESIPFNETRGYVEKVMFNTWIYEQRFRQPLASRREIAANRWPQL